MGDAGAEHVLDMRTALEFPKMREAALSVVVAAVEVIADPDHGRRISDIGAAIRSEVEYLREASDLFLSAGAASGSLHSDARTFADAMSSASTALGELAVRGQKVLLPSIFSIVFFLPTAVASAVGLQIDEIETKFLHSNSILEFSHSQDPERTCAPGRDRVQCLSKQDKLAIRHVLNQNNSRFLADQLRRACSAPADRA
jgi:hypothetical protein